MSMFRPAARALHAARDWPVTSQQTARRNAKAASTARARDRAEREDAEAFVREHRRPPPVAPAESNPPTASSSRP